jgi:hypothetical protein
MKIMRFATLTIMVVDQRKESHWFTLLGVIPKVIKRDQMASAFIKYIQSLKIIVLDFPWTDTWRK